MPPREVNLHVQVTPGDPRPVDGLCPRCLLPSLVTLDLCSVTEAGVSKVGSWTGCAEEDCDEGSR
jgi:hypothetical protein